MGKEMGTKSVRNVGYLRVNHRLGDFLGRKSTQISITAETRLCFSLFDYSRE